MSEEEPTEIEEITYFLEGMSMIDTKYFSEISKFIQKQDQAINKLINYIAVIDHMDYEEVKEKFEV